MDEGEERRRSQGNEISGVEWRVYQGRGRLTVDGGILIGRRKHKEDEKRKEGSHFCPFSALPQRCTVRTTFASSCVPSVWTDEGRETLLFVPSPS